MQVSEEQLKERRSEHPDLKWLLDIKDRIEYGKLSEKSGKDDLEAEVKSVISVGSTEIINPFDRMMDENLSGATHEAEIDQMIKDAEQAAALEKPVPDERKAAAASKEKEEVMRDETKSS